MGHAVRNAWQAAGWSGVGLGCGMVGGWAEALWAAADDVMVVLDKGFGANRTLIDKARGFIDILN